MAVDTFWVVPAEVLQQHPSFRNSVTVDRDALLYLDANNSVWGSHSSGVSPIYADTSQEWCTLCAHYISLTGKTQNPSPPLHKWNVGFEWKRPNQPHQFFSQSQVDLFDKQGWVVLEDAISPEIVERLITETDKVESEGEEKLKQMRGRRAFIARADEITFTTHLVNRCSFLRQFYASRIFTDVCRDLIGDNVRLYWDQAVYKKPGAAKPFPWHQDNGYTFVEPQAYLTFWVGLTEATEENGCMWFVPGIHKLGTVFHELTDIGYACFKTDPYGAVSVPTRPGTVIVMSSLTPHKTGHNSTNMTRRALVSQFVPDGAVAITEDAWGKVERVRADLPDRQFKILEDGKPCAV
jgi:ectoine hydroxylase-related dioxygenase (phytanoyl-CoA dioxygenase family)